MPVPLFRPLVVKKGSNIRSFINVRMVFLEILDVDYDNAAVVYWFAIACHRVLRPVPCSALIYPGRVAVTVRHSDGCSGGVYSQRIFPRIRRFYLLLRINQVNHPF